MAIERVFVCAHARHVRVCTRVCTRVYARVYACVRARAISPPKHYAFSFAIGEGLCSEAAPGKGESREGKQACVTQNPPCLNSPFFPIADRRFRQGFRREGKESPQLVL